MNNEDGLNKSRIYLRVSPLINYVLHTENNGLKSLNKSFLNTSDVNCGQNQLWGATENDRSSLNHLSRCERERDCVGININFTAS